MAQQKIAIVNSDEIVMAMPEMKTVQTQLQDLDKSSYSMKLQKKYAGAVRTKTEAFIAESEKLDETIRKGRQQELIDLQDVIQQSRL